MDIKKRDTSIDLLKSFGMFLIIIAHSNPSEWLFELRTFDVPLLVFISASTFSLSLNEEIWNFEKYFQYLWKRFKRLVIPTWLFLFIYFFIFEIIDVVSNNKIIDFNLNILLTSFLLLSGIGFVWIIRVYFLIAIIAPILKLITKNKLINYVILILLFFINYVLFYQISFSNHLIQFLNNEVLLYISGYGTIFVSGLLFYKLSKKETIFNTFGLVLILGIYFYFTKDFDIQSLKYPPRSIYLVYGIIFSNILLLISKTSFVYRISQKRIFYYFSKYSLDIYFIHIFPVQLLYYNIFHISKNNFPLRFLFISCITIILSYIYINYKVKSEEKRL